MKLLVTGGAGFIGANFVRYWAAHHPDDTLVVYDALTYAGNRASIDDVLDGKTRHFVRGDIRDETTVEDTMRRHDIDTVVHFAAESHVDRSIDGPEAFLTTNVLGTQTLLKVAKALWLDDNIVDRPVRFHHVSTDEVYGSLGGDDPAFSETTPYDPRSPYSASKAASDHLVSAYFHTYGLPVTLSNCSNNYGPYHYPEKLIPLVITNILRGRALPVYGDGHNIRDWLYVDDHVRGIELALKHGVPGARYNIGGHNEKRNIDIVELICDLVDARLVGDPAYRQRYDAAPVFSGGRARDLITFVADRPGHDRRYAINPDKARDVLGYLPEVSFEDGIARTVAWFLDHPHWWQPLLTK